jgi:hypothetical protein
VTAWFALILAGCDARFLTDPDFELPRQFEPPVPMEPGDAARALVARSPMHPFAFQAHADAGGVWLLTFEGDGYGLDLRPEPGEGLELHRLEGGEADGRITIHPGPPLEGEDFTQVLSARQIHFVPSTEPGWLAFWYEGGLYRFDGTRWEVESWDPAVGPDPSTSSCLGVGPERSVWVQADGGIDVVEGGVARRLDTPPGIEPVDELVSGPFDGRRMRAGWTVAGELCTAQWDLADDTLIGTTCLDLGVPLLFRTPLGGRPELARAVVSVDPPQFGRFMLVAFGDEVVVEGAIEDAGRPHEVVDHPQHDWFVYQPENPDALYPTTQMILPDGSFTWVDRPANAIQPAADCPCTENDPQTCWCLPRTLSAGTVGQASPLSFWNVAGEVHDGVRYVWADVWTDSGFDTTLDPTLELLDFEPEDLLDTIEPFVQAPGWTGYVDLNDCRTVVDSTGAELLPDDQGRYVLDDFETYEVTYENCLPPDGGPPLLPIGGLNPPGSTDAFDLTGASLGRGWPVDPADDPPQVVVAVDQSVLILRETSGWTLIEQDGAGIAQTSIDTPSAAPPRILADGRVLLAAGDLFDPASGAASQSIDLLSTPEQTFDVAGLLIDDSPAGLRIHDLSNGSVTTVVDEPGPRTAQLVDVSDDGLTLLETDGQSIWARRPGVGQADLGSVQVALRRGRLSADGNVAVVGLQTSATSVQQSSLTAWPLSESTGLIASGQTLCTECAAGWAFDRSTGAVLGPRIGGNGLSVYRPNGELPGSAAWAMLETEITDAYVAPPSPFATAAHSTDAYDWAWYSSGQDLVGFDFVTDTVLPYPAIDPTGEVRSGPNGLRWVQADGAGVEWYRLDGPQTWVFHHRPFYDEPIELAGGRAAQVNGGSLQVGTWSVGDAQITGPIAITDFPPVMLADIVEPRFAGAPCVLYALESQPSWVTSAPSWACVR